MGKLGIGFALFMAVVFATTLIAVPLLLIWCLNTLGASISYGFWEWVAAAILSTMFLSGSGGGQGS